jgi:hypothetical protein
MPIDPRNQVISITALLALARLATRRRSTFSMCSGV